MKRILSVFDDFLSDNFVRPDVPKDGRIGYIDLAKGICILMVIFMHVAHAFEVYMGEILVLVRMPLYFTLAGLFFKDYGGIIHLAERKINKILVPFLFFWIGAAFLLRLVLPAIYPGKFGLHEFIEGLFGPDITNFPVWFLLCLFWQNLIFGELTLWLRKEWMRAVAVAICVFAGYQLCIAEISLPLYIDSSLSGLGFFYMGFLLRRYTNFLTSRRVWRDLLIGAAAFIIAELYWNLAGRTFIVFFGNYWGEATLWVLLVNAIFTVGVLSVSKVVRWLPIVSYFGRYSIIALGVHYCYFRLGYYVFNKMGDPKEYVWVILAGVLLATWLTIPVLRNLLPGLTAQSDGYVRLVRKKKSVLAKQ